MVSRCMPIARVIVLLFALTLLAGTVTADEPPEGITVNVIAEYASRVPGIEKVRLVRVVMEPGAAFRNVEIKSEEYCELEQGTLTHTNHTTGVTDVLTTGARWAPPKGDYHTVVNSGDDVVDMWVYQLIEEGETADGAM